jgi:hypothetical protein
VPVKVLRTVTLADIPAAAQRRHPQWGDHQLEVGYLLQRVLKPDRPADALAYIAFTADDLWPAATPPEKEYNFVFGHPGPSRTTLANVERGPQLTIYLTARNRSRIE